MTSINPIPAPGSEVLISTTDFEDIRGWVHPIKSTDEALAIMIGKRKTPRMVPIQQIRHWVFAY